MTQRASRRMKTIVGILVVSVSFGACSHVSQEDLDTRLEQLREELRSEFEQGDERVHSDLEGRLGEMSDRIDALERELGSLADELDASMERMGDAIRFNAPVHFAFDEAEIREQDRSILDRYAGVVKEYYPGAVITVEGFTDPVGDEAYNMDLGMRRAKAVKQYLAESGGIAGSQLRAVSYGEQQNRLLKPGEGGPDDGVVNRRVVLVIEGMDGGMMMESGEMD